MSIYSHLRSPRLKLLRFPNRPRNHSLTLPFHELYQSLFNQLDENRKKPTGPPRAKKTAVSRKNLSPHEARRAIIESFFSRWRKEVGDDIFPAMRLIIPEKDRDRGMVRFRFIQLYTYATKNSYVRQRVKTLCYIFAD